MIDELVSYNREFVKNKGYEKYITNKYPDKKIAIVSCMDTRLTELLPASLGIKNGDVKIIKNAGAIISHPFGSVIRSLMVAIYERGIPQERIDMIRYCGINFESWLRGFETSEASVHETVEQIRNHPLIPSDITVRGFVIDSVTGELTPVE